MEMEDCSKVLHRKKKRRSRSRPKMTGVQMVSAPAGKPAAGGGRSNRKEAEERRRAAKKRCRTEKAEDANGYGGDEEVVTSKAMELKSVPEAVRAKNKNGDRRGRSKEAEERHRVKKAADKKRRAATKKLRAEKAETSRDDDEGAKETEEGTTMAPS